MGATGGEVMAIARDSLEVHGSLMADVAGMVTLRHPPGRAPALAGAGLPSGLVDVADPSLDRCTALPPEPGFVRGDCDGSGQRDISDAIGILSFLFAGGGAPTCPEACDA